MLISDDATGLGEKVIMDSDGSATAKWFDLQGRKLDGKPTKRGLYIMNGKKVVIK